MATEDEIKLTQFVCENLFGKNWRKDAEIRRPLLGIGFAVSRIILSANECADGSVSGDSFLKTCQEMSNNGLICSKVLAAHKIKDVLSKIANVSKEPSSFESGARLMATVCDMRNLVCADVFRVGAKSFLGSRKAWGGPAIRETRNAECQKKVREKVKGGIGITQARRLVARELGVSERTVRRATDNLEK